MVVSRLVNGDRHFKPDDIETVRKFLGIDPPDGTVDLVVGESTDTITSVRIEAHIERSIWREDDGEPDYGDRSEYVGAILHPTCPPEVQSAFKLGYPVENLPEGTVLVTASVNWRAAADLIDAESLIVVKESRGPLHRYAAHRQRTMMAKGFAAAGIEVRPIGVAIAAIVPLLKQQS